MRALLDSHKKSIIVETIILPNIQKSHSKNTVKLLLIINLSQSIDYSKYITHFAFVNLR